MRENYIALILPEFSDEDNTCSSPDWVTTDIPSDDIVGGWIANVLKFVDFYSDEDCQLLIDGDNVRGFVFILDTLPECYPSRSLVLTRALYNLKNWRKNRLSKIHESFFESGRVISNDIRVEGAIRVLETGGNSFILVHVDSIFPLKTWSLSSPNGDKIDIQSFPMDIKTVYEWLIKNHIPIREYVWSEKHGENGIGAFPMNKGSLVSVLECSREDAARLLQRAIGLPSSKELHYFDVQRNKYMEFKVGGCIYDNNRNVVKKQYHSYHINTNYDIPKRVLKKIDEVKEW